MCVQDFVCETFYDYACVFLSVCVCEGERRIDRDNLVEREAR